MELIDRNQIRWIACEYLNNGCQLDASACKTCLLSRASYKQVHNILIIDAIPINKVNDIIKEISKLQTYVLYKGDTKKVDLNDTIKIIKKYTNI